MLSFLDLRPRAILVRCFAKDGLELPNEMKMRETGSPSHRNDGEELVLPISQQIVRMAESAQKFRVNHLFRTTIIAATPGNAVRFRVPRCRPVPDHERHQEVLPTQTAGPEASQFAIWLIEIATNSRFANAYCRSIDPLILFVVFLV
jgi:hypothetical protein